VEDRAGVGIGLEDDTVPVFREETQRNCTYHHPLREEHRFFHNKANKEMDKQDQPLLDPLHQQRQPIIHKKSLLISKNPKHKRLHQRLGYLTNLVIQTR
jgi:hypothetical protein